MKTSFYAVGQVSKEIYVTGNSKADCMRGLQEKYPTQKKGSRRDQFLEKVLPETVIIVKGRVS